MESIRVIFDTNIWIGFLIGKRLAYIKNLIVSRQITIVTTDLLITELREVTSRKKLSKYFPPEAVAQLIDLLRIISAHYTVKPKHQLSRDAKDNFLLDLIDVSKADYLVTEDKDLLALNPFKTAEINTPAKFEAIIKILKII